MQKYADTVTTRSGKAVAGASITVYNQGTTTPATIYSDNGITPITGLATDSLGKFEFYAADGRYDIEISGTGIQTQLQTDILLEDPADNPAPTVAALSSSTGTSLVGHIASGTGAAATTVQAKLRETISLQDFGATGDGTTDDRASIVNAVTAAAGQKIHVTPGTFKLDSAYAAPATAKLHLETGASFTTSALTGATLEYETARATAVAASKMRIDWLREQSAYKLEDEAGIWPAQTFAFAAYSKEFTASDLTDGAGSPSTTFFAFANNNGLNGDVVALMGDAVARSNNGTVFGANLLVRNGSGTTNTKLVGMEIDLQPSAGTTMANGSLGLALNVFNLSTPATAILLGGLGGGTFADGILVNAVRGAGLAAQTGSSAMNSLIDASQGTYNNDAIILGNTHKLRLQGTGSTHAKLYNDNSDNVRFVLGSGVLAVRNSTDTASLYTFAATGTLAIESGDVTFVNTKGVTLFGTASTHARLYNDSSNNVRLVLGTGQFVVRNSADNASLFSFDTGGGLTLSTLKVGGNQVVAGRITGYTAFSGTTDKVTALDASTVTLAQLAQRVAAIQASLTSHGLIGA